MLSDFFGMNSIQTLLDRSVTSRGLVTVLIGLAVNLTSIWLFRALPSIRRPDVFAATKRLVEKVSIYPSVRLLCRGVTNAESTALLRFSYDSISVFPKFQVSLLGK